MNHIILIGRLTADPEIKTLESGTSVARFTLAVDRPFTNAQGERQPDFIPVAAWGKLGELVGQYLAKGRQVAVAGRLQIRSYTTDDNERRTFAEVVADEVKFLDRPHKNEIPADEDDEEDVPF
ncbi:MAG: single-stranded DNA-binding protein [Clostridiales bacterium]|nr:single-stranded DNA-binding protein [Clostridiales bacterium]